MTDEEMAEEFVDTLLTKDNPEVDEFLSVNLKGVKFTSKQAGTLLGIIKGVGICSYLAALKAGRPKWHKVADGDLPKRTGEYLTNIGVLTWDYYGDGRYGWHTELCEHCECMDDVDSDEVIAWCEIPKYTRKK